MTEVHVWQGTLGQLSTNPPFGRAATTTVEDDAVDDDDAAAAITSSMPRDATAFASPCSPPAGSKPTGIGALAAPNDFTTEP